MYNFGVVHYICLVSWEQQLNCLQKKVDDDGSILCQFCQCLSRVQIFVFFIYTKKDRLGFAVQDKFFRPPESAVQNLFFKVFLFVKIDLNKLVILKIKIVTQNFS